jgi:hypothetical protein
MSHVQQFASLRRRKVPAVVCCIDPFAALNQQYSPCRQVEMGPSAALQPKAAMRK